MTFEFENVPSAVASTRRPSWCPVRPGGAVLHIAQHRLREKTFLAANGFPVTPFVAGCGRRTIWRPPSSPIGLPAVLKTAGFGYDGKGQAKIRTPEDVAGGRRRRHDTTEMILEAFVDFACEVSVVGGARASTATVADCGVIENVHANHILDVSVAPAGVAAGGRGRKRSESPAACSRRSTSSACCASSSS